MELNNHSNLAFKIYEKMKILIIKYIIVSLVLLDI